jgi:hypothetical protein
MQAGDDGETGSVTRGSVGFLELEDNRVSQRELQVTALEDVSSVRPANGASAGVLAAALLRLPPGGFFNLASHFAHPPTEQRR